MKKKQKIEIHNEEVREIMKEIPGSLLHWGLSVIFLIFLGIIIGSYFFKFKEIVTAPVVITTLNPPASIVSKSAGRIKSWFVNDGEILEEGQLIALIQNQAELNDILFLEERLKNVDYELNEVPDFNLSISEKPELGDLQERYNELSGNFRNYKKYIENDFIPQKVKLLNAQVVKQKQQYQLLLDQQKMMGQELEITRNTFSRHKSILDKGGVSEAQYQEAQARLIASERAYSAFLSSVKGAEISLMNQERSLLELKEQHSKEIASFIGEIDRNIKSLEIGIANWKSSYLLKSPICGKITLTKFWSENHIINAGERLATVVPIDSSQVICRATVKSIGIAKIAKGQKVQIKLAGYPYMEHGFLTGIIRSFSLVPEQDGYVVEIKIEKGMISNYKHQLKLVQEMDGTAEIVTGEMRIIYRFINPLKMLFKR